MRLRWKLTPRETGLRTIGASPRGYTLHLGSEELASVYPAGGNWSRPLAGWYWACGETDWMPHANTANDLKVTPEEAKAEAETYVKQYLKERKP